MAERLPPSWFDGPVDVTVDRDEITIVGRIPAPEGTTELAGAEGSAAVTGRIKEFREQTRDLRIQIARELEHRARRKVSWGVECAGRRQLFTTLSMPVMTRLRQPERQVLDTLVDAGVARSRAEALAWCVKLTGQNTEAWLARLREAMAKVQEMRAAGPTLGRSARNELIPGGE
ncbi:MAG: hypothetical protein ICV70_01495 [Jiangellaceae bacterium]|nr:hypothetical protein [Jiangellaceae bacterium]